MDILLDDPATERIFQELLTKIRLLKNGETVAQMKARGVNYRINWGASVISLRQLSKQYTKNHLLALKLWNKQWRETMILATLLDDPAELSEEQMDYWTKSFETPEIAEQAVANLFVYSKFAFVKALEYCRGKKHLVRLTGLQLIGRLAMTDKKAIDEMFEPFFDVLTPLAKDPALGQIFYRTMILMANRGTVLRKSCKDFLSTMLEMEEDHAKSLACLLLEDITKI
ncbi:MAG: hypothetical protein A2W90_13730 [Bacteroidetes bacterium GWF2_42_66]|nr:MAG: hypothetical protein A2W92_14445 [Bacteroidetes bacterium GWA2_42_15]OFX97318.1 MAG: hypothetical protein A2W89_00905 [Bacteroidetes bacterium GWE2_42_39]OFY39955.1 MAG: hypothetical protein A2W90_13730 [Bacteroidetes bacterium GWF2_42_66]HBL78142.1 hypothetical protein [Prolixibacteraceae bacterium]HCR91109.1 hypothetical protein [Prolixibacteraceae bacterium]